MDLRSFKLIIWDLDNTFWDGTLSEGEIHIPKRNMKLVHDIVDDGIMCSICSKNNKEEVESILEREGMLDYFVF